MVDLPGVILSQKAALSLSQLLSVTVVPQLGTELQTPSPGTKLPMSHNQALKVQKKKTIYIFLYDTVRSL